MRAVIRFLTRGSGGTVEQRDKLFEGDAITLGRATDQVLHLKDRRVDLKHARIFRRGERVLISSGALAGVTVNGAVTRDAALAAGDVVVIGSNTLRFFAPPVGFDLAFTFELDASARSTEALREPPLLRLSQTRLAKRPWAWGLFLVVLFAALIVPALGLRDAGLQSSLREGPMPDDGWWLSGPLSPVHQSLVTQCESCHEKPFVRVRNEACLQCHAQNVHQHAEEQIEQLEQERCTACHREHEEPAMLVRNDPRLCGDCHADLESLVGPGHGAEPATDFATAHPQFRVTLLEPGAGGKFEPRRLRLEEAAGAERSGLKFPHDVHLDTKGIRTPTETVVMACADCHRAEEGGARMRPIRMERDCASCHRLDFEPADPERTVPHGDPAQVLRTLVEYYSARYLEEYPDAHATARPARVAARPGVDLNAAERARALERARTKALATARDLFERRACNTCHEVEATGSGADAAWRVTSVQLTREWMPKANFSHARHSTTLTACTTCHAADRSAQATDVVMPGIQVCRDCHGGAARLASASARVPSDCTLCHSFHVAGNELWAGVGRMPGPSPSP